MKQHLLIAAIIGAIAMPSHAAQPATAAKAGPGEGVGVSFVDGPTGFGYVWRPDAGWKFVGQNGEGHTKAASSSPEGFADGAALAEFIDATTGFRFVWQHGAGWKFAGRT